MMMSDSHFPEHLNEILEAFGLAGARATLIEIGNINQTYRLDAGHRGTFSLQWLNPIFRPEIHHDIYAVTEHLKTKGILTPELVPTRDGSLWFEIEHDVWRVMRWIDGHTFRSVASLRQARESGRILGCFHRALADFNGSLGHFRLGVHDTAKHLRVLRSALREHDDHLRFHLLEALGKELLETADALPTLSELPDKLVHGDPKVSNIVFTADRESALALIDLDTLAEMPLPLELGDALRSWCNPGGEDNVQAHFELEFFRAALEGYASECRECTSSDEQEAIVTATETIIVELAVRFAADALNESYFGWDQNRFTSRSEHNEHRARSQLALARSFAEQRDAAYEIVARAFGA